MVDLRSRAGGGGGEVRGVADVSMASAKLVLDQNLAGRGAWVIAARRSHLGVLSNGLGSLGLDTIDLPYVFHDLAGRVDLALGRRTQLEASGLWEQDRLEGDVEGVLERTRSRWGNAAGRATVRTLLGALELSTTLGASRFAVRTDDRLVRTRDPAPSWTEPASRNDIEHTQLSGVLRPATSSLDVGGAAAAEGVSWSLGYDIAWQHGDYDGPLPRYHAVKPDTSGRLRYQRDLRVASGWGDVRIPIGKQVTLNPALRVETGDTFALAPRVRVAPRLAARWTLSADQSISVAAGRSWQYVQAIALAGPSIHPAFHAAHFWIWPDATTPAIRADVVSLGSERWLGHGWLASAGLYARRAIGVAQPDPDTGALGRRRPLFSTAQNQARGLELHLRRIGAQWSAAVGYTHGKSEMILEDSVDYSNCTLLPCRSAPRTRTYPASADRRHVFDAMLGVRLLRDWRLAVAYTAMSGAPFTRAYAVTRQDCASFGFHCSSPDGAYVQEPNALRTPAYRSLDASVQWARALGPVELSAYLQVRNVLDRDNASTYSGSRPIARVMSREGTTYRFEDRFEKGLPRLPLVGMRMTF